MDTVDERTGEKVEKVSLPINTAEDFARLRGLWSQMPMIPKVTRVEAVSCSQISGLHDSDFA